MILSFLISIHALLAESDVCLQNRQKRHNNFYPRSPCGERQRGEHHANSQQEFLSTLSLRRATSGNGHDINRGHNFYPRSPCGERLDQIKPRGFHYHFYPRSPCGERQMHALIFANPVLFLSTLSLRRATGHAVNLHPKTGFLSTLSLRRATRCRAASSAAWTISIHALLAERDDASKDVIKTTTNFYPRSPCGERRARLQSCVVGASISIHALLAESDRSGHR